MSSVWCTGQQHCTVTLMERMFCILVHSTCTIMEASHLDAMITTSPASKHATNCRLAVSACSRTALIEHLHPMRKPNCSQSSAG